MVGLFAFSMMTLLLSLFSHSILKVTKNSQLQLFSHKDKPTLRNSERFRECIQSGSADPPRSSHGVVRGNLVFHVLGESPIHADEDSEWLFVVVDGGTVSRLGSKIRQEVAPIGASAVQIHAIGESMRRFLTSEVQRTRRRRRRGVHVSGSWRGCQVHVELDCVFVLWIGENVLKLANDVQHPLQALRVSRRPDKVDLLWALRAA